MIVVLSKDVWIEAEDGVSFTLKRSGGKHGKVLGYYGTLEQAARRALDKALFDVPGRVGVERLVEMLDVASQRVAMACEGAASAAGSAMLEGVAGAAEVPDELFDEVG
jgi:hypothetical protein